MFLHHLQQGALHLGGRAVDFVGQHEIGENGPLLDREFARPGVKNLRADHIGRQQVRRELNARKRQAKPLGQRAHGQRLGQTGHAFEEDVPSRQQADQQSIQHRPLSDDDAL